MAGSSTDEGAGGEFSLFLPAFSMQTAYRAVTQFGGLDQLADRSLRMREVPGSKPGFSIFASLPAPSSSLPLLPPPLSSLLHHPPLSSPFLLPPPSRRVA